MNKEERTAFILDLIRCAAANGTHKEVAEALALDWNPPYAIDAKGKAAPRISES